MKEELKRNSNINFGSSFNIKGNAYLRNYGSKGNYKTRYAIHCKVVGGNHVLSKINGVT